MKIFKITPAFQCNSPINNQADSTKGIVYF